MITLTPFSDTRFPTTLKIALRSSYTLGNFRELRHLMPRLPILLLVSAILSRPNSTTTLTPSGPNSPRG